MFAVRSFLLAFLVALVLAVFAPQSGVNALPSDRYAVLLESRAAPSYYDSKHLESYDVYHARYIALECANYHDTKFFKVCCGPLAKGKALSTRPDICDPATYEDCEEDDA
ncbi:hypothetical protein EXIGLDRAFT_837810 [Exidia glandulosa HHB12029]|uniref:Uncharacterized protein n=1 Tax=Exidia glandulosa HHB12029 TaxID=1314781 RepID=A0A165GEP4_EXIGL|nr:hypothetical protein EXIGLDRAFT_837810 [Exidia glandulosa HHB12029]